MSWSSRRRTIYLGIFMLILLAVFTLAYYFFIYEKPTCLDGKQNQNEQGIDCGGVCPIVCGFQTVDPIVMWSRIFKVTDGIYNAVAVVENPNVGVEAYGVPYSFKVYDKDNIIIYERRGKTDIFSRSTLPIFERTILTDQRIPVRVLFEFVKKPEWIKVSEERPELFVTNKNLTGEDSAPRLFATVENRTAKTIKNIEVSAILFDIDGNAINASQTVIDSLSKNGSEQVFFTWPEVFPSKVSRIEIITIAK
ncbi:FxLYD domain-containing protein [Patescibacteria group bacterium]|nr:FxLYD domain-containing protein [Patescibacteria group bacterium]